MLVEGDTRACQIPSTYKEIDSFSFFEADKQNARVGTARTLFFSLSNDQKR